MNQREAKELSKSDITYGQIMEMLKHAYDDGAANDDRSNLNPVISKAWKVSKSDLKNRNNTTQ